MYTANTIFDLIIYHTLTCNHDGFGVAAQTVLQEPGEYRVTVWDKYVLPGMIQLVRCISWVK